MWLLILIVGLCWRSSGGMERRWISARVGMGGGFGTLGRLTGRVDQVCVCGSLRWGVMQILVAC